MRRIAYLEKLRHVHRHLAPHPVNEGHSKVDWNIKRRSLLHHTNDTEASIRKQKSNRAALDDVEALSQKVQTPWGHLVVDRFVGIVTVDPSIHTFDLAVATGQEVVIDPGLADAGYTQLQKAGDMIRGERFGPEIELDGDKSIVEMLIAMAGRDPLMGS